MELSPTAFSVSELAQEALSQVAVLADRNRNLLELELNDRTPVAFADRNKLTQALLNLLSNALKFTQDGRVRLTIQRVGDHVELEVMDNGTGIAADDLAVLFEPYTRVGDRPEGGTGLGLSIARELCRLMGGDLTATSRPGFGSAFTITVPAADDAALAGRQPRRLQGREHGEPASLRQGREPSPSDHQVVHQGDAQDLPSPGHATGDLDILR